MKCKECKHFNKIANTEETGQGICGYPMSYVPVGAEDECAFAPKPYTCGDCSHFVEGDAACFTCQAKDSAYRDGELCCGFIDKNKDLLYNILVEWKMRGFNVDEELKEVLYEFDEFECPWD